MRSSFARRLALLALVPAALFGVVTVATPARAAAPTTASLEANVLYWTNKYRAANGCGAVRSDAKLVRAARGHSGWMARTGRFSHTGTGGSTFVMRAKWAGYTAARSENIAWGYRSGDAVIRGWMNSPGHKRNLLDCRAKAVGIGVAYASNGNPYYTQNFGSV